MDRRRFSMLAASAAATLAMGPKVTAHEGHDASPEATDVPVLAIDLTDSDIVAPATIPAGLVAFTMTNTGDNRESHVLAARLPDGISADDVFAIFAAEESGATPPVQIDFERDLTFLGIPDWPVPGGSVSGYVMLEAGTYIFLDIFGGRTPGFVVAEGEAVAREEPAADIVVTLKDMIIDLPEAAFTTAPMRWKVENIGSIPHEVSVVAVPLEMTVDDLMYLFSLPPFATPEPGRMNIDYYPVAAIGVLAGGGTSWLDVQLEPGHYVAVCPIPFGTGYPHVMDGMYVFFDVAAGA